MRHPLTSNFPRRTLHTIPHLFSSCSCTLDLCLFCTHRSRGALLFKSCLRSRNIGRKMRLGKRKSTTVSYKVGLHSLSDELTAIRNANCSTHMSSGTPVYLATTITTRSIMVISLTILPVRDDIVASRHRRRAKEMCAVTSKTATKL